MATDKTVETQTPRGQIFSVKYSGYAVTVSANDIEVVHTYDRMSTALKVYANILDFAMSGGKIIDGEP